MKPSVYIETTIASYLTARASTDLIVAARQALTRIWWEEHSGDFACSTSIIVLDEAARGDRDAAERRLKLLSELPVLQLSLPGLSLARSLIAEGAIPPSYDDDALHIATAAVNGIEFLLTWNCKHLANAFLRRKVASIIADTGFQSPEICTPEELMER